MVRVEPAASPPGSTGGTLPNGIDRGVGVQGLLGVGVGGLEVEHHLFYRSGERLGGLGLVVTVDDEPVVAADVHSGVGRECDGHGAGHVALADQFVSGP